MRKSCLWFLFGTHQITPWKAIFLFGRWCCWRSTERARTGLTSLPFIPLLLPVPRLPLNARKLVSFESRESDKSELINMGLIHETNSKQYTPNKWWQPHESTVEFLLNCHPCVVSQGEGNEGIMDTTFYVSNFKEWKRTKRMFAERVFLLQFFLHSVMEPTIFLFLVMRKFRLREPKYFVKGYVSDQWQNWNDKVCLSPNIYVILD